MHFPGFSFWPYRHSRPDGRYDFRPPYTEIEIPLPPLQSVESITYLSGGVAVTMDPATTSLLASATAGRRASAT